MQKSLFLLFLMFLFSTSFCDTLGRSADERASSTGRVGTRTMRNSRSTEMLKLASKHKANQSSDSIQVENFGSKSSFERQGSNSVRNQNKEYISRRLTSKSTESIHTGRKAKDSHDSEVEMRSSSRSSDPADQRIRKAAKRDENDRSPVSLNTRKNFFYTRKNFLLSKKTRF